MPNAPLIGAIDAIVVDGGLSLAAAGTSAEPVFVTADPTSPPVIASPVELAGSYLVVERWLGKSKYRQAAGANGDPDGGPARGRTESRRRDAGS